MKTKYLNVVCVSLLLALHSTGCKEKSVQNEPVVQGMEIETVTTPKTEDLKKVIRAQIFIKADKVNDFLTFTKNLVEQSRAEEGNISYTLYQDPSDKTKFIFFEEWKNQAAIDFHFNTEHFKEFDATIGEYSTAPAVIAIYDIASEK